MLFYAMLTIAGIVAAAVLLWIIKSVTEAGKTAYRTLSPTARNRPRTRLAHLNQNLAAAPSPWGWSARGRTDAATRTFTDNHDHRHPTPRIAEREQPTLTSMSLRQGNTGVLQDGAREAARKGSVRNVLTGYDLGRQDPITATSTWQYRSLEQPVQGEERQLASLRPAPTQQTRQGAAEDAPAKDDTAASSKELREKPWGW